METTNENLIEVLNDLIRINNDRTEGYLKAIDELDNIDVDLKTVFEKMAADSRDYKQELSREVVALGGEVATGTTNMGKIYRVWMDVKATFTGTDREAVLNSCEYGEDAAQEAYEEALKSDTPLPVDLRHLIGRQKASLLEAHNLIKNYRDLQEDIND
ncbi:uncharacterized protein (TIGR02284 family) [Dyadobacter jejuensis]|uniref:Uncharacterized protein (TIGR02284 family) n=1 Tax=Dyadobacter jejuensis TaxID=1082580 RepID=A0A316AML6_9BACT|nr:PA2169 family four-helix-bundle protein [Dyadobacter jejuensis]PWJ58324.1 uncharacterized protein (TIGR02284 family) [Dyadobacter jejuensis]